MKTLINFATRSRPTKLFACLDNIRNLSTVKNYDICVKADLDDSSMNCNWVKVLLSAYPEVDVQWGYSESKVHAINRNLSEWVDGHDVIINMSDDLLFLENGFDEIIENDFKTLFPNFDGLLHYPDNFAKGRTCTHTIMGVNLYKKLGYMYHPDFISVYCDNHLTELTRKMGKYAFVNKKILEHMHPHASLAPWDEQYKKTEHPDIYKKDRETFLKHQANNFGL